MAMCRNLVLLLALSLSHILADSQEYCETEDCKDAATKCKKIDLESRDYDIMNHLYRIRSRNDRTLNLVSEVSKAGWRNLAEVLDLHPSNIENNHRRDKNVLLKVSQDLFDKIYQKGYEGRFTWRAYVEALRKIPELDNVVNDLESMLDCKGIDRDDIDAVKPLLFKHMSCSSQTFKLIEQASFSWREIAITFKIDPEFILDSKKIDEKCSYDVLSELYRRGYKGSFTWQGVLNALSDADLPLVVQKLENALECVID